MRLGDLIRFRPKSENNRLQMEWSPPALIISDWTPLSLDDSGESVTYLAICDGMKVLVSLESDEIEIIEKTSAEIP